MKRFDIKNFINILFSIFFRPISYLFPKGNIVILGTYSRQKYGENTKYLFEFLSEKEDIDAYWITDNKQIINHLKNSGLNHIGFRSPIKMIWILLRAKVIIDSGTGYFNPFGILNIKKVIKITTSHGNGPKVTVSRFHPPDNHNIGLQQIEDLYKSVERMQKHLDDMANNKVNIEFLKEQMEKAQDSIEKLKDADREIVYKNGDQ